MFLSGELAEDASLKDIITSHNGVLAESAAEASHIVTPNPPKEADEDPELDYLRTLEKKGKNALVHWWYYPDSYDTWLPATEVEVSIVLAIYVVSLSVL